MYASSDFQRASLPIARLPAAEHAMVHVLAGQPFASAARKANAARVAGAWPDVDGYFSSPTARFLAVSAS